MRDVPALGYKILRLETTDQPRAQEPAATNSLTLENVFYKLTVDPDEAAKLVNPAYQDKMVDSLAKAIEEYATARALRTAAVAAPKAVSKL